jgi:hypothetical protein
MIVNLSKLIDFTTNHSQDAESAIQAWICAAYNLNAGEITQGYDPRFDFEVNDRRVELKISSKGTSDGIIELMRDDYSPAGLSATKADVHAFLNPAGRGTAKLRLIKTSELVAFYFRNTKNRTLIPSVGNKRGSYMAPLDFKDHKDLMIGECSYANGEFDLSTMRTNTFAKQNISKMFA